MTLWTAVATRGDSAIKQLQRSIEEGFNKIFHGLLQSTWERHVREWVDGERWDEEHISFLAQYARDNNFTDTKVRPRPSLDTVWRPRFRLNGRAEFEGRHTYEIPLAGDVGKEAWDVVEIKSNGSITVIKGSRDSVGITWMDKPVRPLNRTTLGELIDYGDVYRVVDY